MIFFLCCLPCVDEACVSSVQGDGNLVLYKTDHYGWIWATHTSHYRNYGPFKFVVQDGGKVPSEIPKTMNNVGVNGCSRSNPCKACAGDCDSDSDCAPGLKCYQRSGSAPSDIPGCPKEGQQRDWDYCYDPNPGLDNMCLYDKDGVSRWCSGTMQEVKEVEVPDEKDKKKKVKKQVPYNVSLTLQDDGNLVLYREDGKVLWASNTAGRKDVSGAVPASLTGGKQAQQGLSKESDGSPEDVRMEDEQENALIEEDNKALEAEKAADEAEDAETKNHDIDWQPANEEQTSEEEGGEREPGYSGGDKAMGEQNAITYGADPLSSVPDADEEVSGSKLVEDRLQRQAQGARGRGNQRRLAPRETARLEHAHHQQQAPGGIQEVIDSLI